MNISVQPMKMFIPKQKLDAEYNFLRNGCWISHWRHEGQIKLREGHLGLILGLLSSLENMRILRVGGPQSSIMPILF